MAADSAGLSTNTSIQEKQCPVLCSIEAILRTEFLKAASKGREGEMARILFYGGKVNLPSREQVIRLFMFVRNLPGNYRIPKEFVTKIVTKHILVYWRMANYSTSVKDYTNRKVLKEIDKYKLIRKSKINTDDEKEKKKNIHRGHYINFYITSADLEEKIHKDQLLVDRSLPIEKRDQKLEAGMTFLKDQLGPRVGCIGPKDMLYSSKIEDKEKKNQ